MVVNMKINIMDEITLNNKWHFIVSGKTNYDGIIYYLLVDKTNNKNVKICQEVRQNNLIILEETKDNDLIKKISLALLKSTIGLQEV